EVAGPCVTVAEALDTLAGTPPDVAILDVRLGHETVAPVARELVKQGVPFLFYTGQIGTDAALAECPGCRIVAKPALPTTIISVVAACYGDRTRKQSAHGGHSRA